MSVLTKDERDGLEDVFLSIHTNHDKFVKIKEISKLLISKKRDYYLPNFLNHAKYRLKKVGFTQFLTFLDKKKKNLSK